MPRSRSYSTSSLPSNLQSSWSLQSRPIAVYDQTEESADHASIDIDSRPGPSSQGPIMMETNSSDDPTLFPHPSSSSDVHFPLTAAVFEESWEQEPEYLIREEQHLSSQGPISTSPHSRVSSTPDIYSPRNRMDISHLVTPSVHVDHSMLIDWEDVSSLDSHGLSSEHLVGFSPSVHYSLSDPRALPSYPLIGPMYGQPLQQSSEIQVPSPRSSTLIPLHGPTLPSLQTSPPTINWMLSSSQPLLPFNHPLLQDSQSGSLYTQNGGSSHSSTLDSNHPGGGDTNIISIAQAPFVTTSCPSLNISGWRSSSDHQQSGGLHLTPVFVSDPSQPLSYTTRSQYYWLNVSTISTTPRLPKRRFWIGCLPNEIYLMIIYWLASADQPIKYLHQCALTTSIETLILKWTSSQ
ncbi:hypothetical protein QCA50_016401 [Cerrena zonata]|uniref:Uncharacterized protein n=1 Tax=Cerrena zonata TaxID=2478898 RepID=A0AAW0FQW3_9APHY